MKVAVVQGGPSTEAEVSRASAAGVANALGQAGHEVTRHELDESLVASLRSAAPDVVFPVVHGAQGEDGCLQGLLEVQGYAYVGSGVRASAVAADKIATKVFFRSSGLRVAKEAVLSAADLDQPVESLLTRLKAEVGARFIIKPAQGGSTIGMTRIVDRASETSMMSALELALSYDERVLVEEFIDGAEVTCAVLEGDSGTAEALPPTLITAEATDWYDFESKYAPGGSNHQCPAPLESELINSIQASALVAHRALGARDLSRVDFLIPAGGEPVLLELNTLPGMTETSLFPEAAQAAGISFPSLVAGLVERAQARGTGLKLSGAPLPGR